jgi:hypothetical protein
MLIKLLAAQTDLTTANNVSNATVVRLFNSHTSAIIITRTDSSDSAIGSITVNTKESIILEKDPTDKLSAASNEAFIKVVKIAYAN